MMSIVFSMILAASPSATDGRPSVVVVVGAPGTPEYAAEFRRWSDLWQAAASKASADFVSIGLDDGPGTADRDTLRATLADRASETAEPLWIVLLGHGTFDGREAKFNLRGPDLTDVELADWLSALKRPVAIINCASASAPFLARLSAPNRVVVTATRSGSEQNFARFGRFFSESIADPKADLDKDGQVSLLEAYLTAGSRVAEWYKSKSQLATEHSLIDDNADKLGTPSDWFLGVRANRRAKDGAPLDGVRAHQLHLVPSDRERRLPAEARKRRDELEIAVASLRDRKEKLSEDDYYAQLEPLMIELAEVYRNAEKPADTRDDPGHRH